MRIPLHILLRSHAQNIVSHLTETNLQMLSFRVSERPVDQQLRIGADKKHRTASMVPKTDHQNFHGLSGQLLLLLIG